MNTLNCSNCKNCILYETESVSKIDRHYCEITEEMIDDIDQHFCNEFNPE